MNFDLFMQSGISLDRLLSLCEIAEHGSISEATRGNSNRQTQFSRQIGELEDFFDMPLLDRTSRPHRLTAEGTALSSLSRHFLSGLSDLHASSRNEPVEIRIGGGESTIRWLLMPRLNRVTSLVPEATFALTNLRTLQIIDQLENGSLDLGIIRRTALTAELESCAADRYGYRLFIPRTLRDLGGSIPDTISPKDLASLPLALVDGMGEFRQNLERLSRKNEIDLKVKLACSSHAQVATAIESGCYAGFLPSFVQRHMDKVAISSVTVENFDLGSRELVFAWNAKRSVLRPTIRRLATGFLN